MLYSSFYHRFTVSIASTANEKDLAVEYAKKTLS